MKKCGFLFCIFFLCCSAGIFPQIEKRDVPYTKALFEFIEKYFNHEISGPDEIQALYASALDSCPDSYDEYMKETHFARCDYYFGMSVIETYDLTKLEHALDDVNEEFVDPVERDRQIKREAAGYFDRAIEHAKKAVDLRKDSCPDALSIYAQAISANCTVNKIGYVLSNGLKIAKYAKQAVKMDPTNGSACFSSAAQNVYAPGIFGNASAGRKKMLSFLADDTLVVEKFERFNLICAVAYTYYRQNKFADAKIWYEKCLEIYPGNFAVNDLVLKCNSRLENSRQEKNAETGD